MTSGQGFTRRRIRGAVGIAASAALCLGVGGGVLAFATAPTAGAATGPAAAATGTTASPSATNGAVGHFLTLTQIDANFKQPSTAGTKSDAAATSGLSVNAQGQVTGARAQASATPAAIPAGVTIVVNSTADVGQPGTWTTTCTVTVTGSKVCTLRSALEAAWAFSSMTHKSATIHLPAGTFTLTQGQLLVTSVAGVTVDGAGAGATIIASNGTGRVLFVGEATQTTFALNGVTVTGGDASTVDVPDTAAHGHSAQPKETGTTFAGCGGGIADFDPTGIIELDTDAVTANKAAFGGGGICAGGTLYASGTNISGNVVQPTATDSSFDIYGGGLLLGWEFPGTAYLSNDTITDNTVSTATNAVEDNDEFSPLAAGGGVAAISGSSAVVTGSNISGNTVTSGDQGCESVDGTTPHTAPPCELLLGGGLYDQLSNVQLDSSTVNGNTVSQSFNECDEDCDFATMGGGIANFGGLAVTTDTIDGNQLTNGTGSVASLSAGLGGGIVSYQPITIEHSWIDSNSITGTTVEFDTGGGGIFQGAPGFTMNTSTVSSNTVEHGEGGGAIITGGVTFEEASPVEEETTGAVLNGDVISDNTAGSTATGTEDGNGSAGGVLFTEEQEGDEDATAGQGSAASTPGIDGFGRGSVQVTDTSINNNTAAALGGGVLAKDDTSVQMIGSTVSGNTSSLGGGVALLFESTLAAQNSTFADNAAVGTLHTGDFGFTDSGGGFFLTEEEFLNLSYDTVTGNTATTTGGGIQVFDTDDDFSGWVNTVGTIIAGNTATGDAVTSPSFSAALPKVSGAGEQDCDVAFPATEGATAQFPLTSGGWNIDGDNSCGLNQPTDQTTTNPDLGPLANNGGSTLTEEPNAGSPAITHGGSTPTCPATDQRGIARPQGQFCDVGAVEVSTGYWLAGADGGVFALGGTPFFGSATTGQLTGPVIGIASLPNNAGYWLVTSNGGVFPFGAAVNYGTEAKHKLHAPIVGIVATSDGLGYWLVGADGGLFAFGDAPFLGSLPSIHITTVKNVVGMTVNDSDTGYWMVGATGAIYAFGAAGYHGGANTGVTLTGPVVGVAADASGGGYWITTTGGGIFSYGDAQFEGSIYTIPASTRPLHAPITGIIPAEGGAGYWLVGGDGGVFAFNAPFEGSLPEFQVMAKDIVGIAAG
jgi:hypothetical protein